MNKFLSAIAVAVVGGGLLMSEPAQAAGKVTYLDPGTDQLSAAAARVSVGDTVILRDGEYRESRSTIPVNGGTSSTNRVTFKAEHSGKVKIVYTGAYNTQRFTINKPFIAVQGLDLTVATRGTTTADIVLAVRKGGDFAYIRNNHLHGVFEDGLKLSEVSGIYVYANLIDDIDHEGLDAINIGRSTIQANTISSGRVGIVAKGGSRYISMVGNNVTSVAYGIAVGGSTGSLSTLTVKGYEAYGLTVTGNVVKASGTGIGVLGSYYSRVTGNTITAPTPIRVGNGGDPVGSYGQLPWSCKSVGNITSPNSLR
jgi:hypothetical protein